MSFISDANLVRVHCTIGVFRYSDLWPCLQCEHILGLCLPQTEARRTSEREKIGH